MDEAQQRQQNPSFQVLHLPPTKVSIPFKPILFKAAQRLDLHEPTYQVLNAAHTRVSVELQCKITDEELTYTGESADNIEDPSEVAARAAVHDMIKRFGVIVEDYTFNHMMSARRCGSLYRVLRTELEEMITTPTQAILLEQIPTTPPGSIHISLDHMTVLRKIYQTVSIRSTPLHTLEHYPGSNTSWIAIKGPHIYSLPQFLIGPTCPTQELAKDYLAKQAIEYLIQSFNLQIIDANYGLPAAKEAETMYDLERKSYLGVHELLFGHLQQQSNCSQLVEQDSIFVEGKVTYPPAHRLYQNQLQELDAIVMRSAAANSARFKAALEKKNSVPSLFPK